MLLRGDQRAYEIDVALLGLGRKRSTNPNLAVDSKLGIMRSSGFGADVKLTQAAAFS